MAEGVALALVLCLQAALVVRGLNAAVEYDEGVYLGSLDALRAGQELGTDIFAAQPPGFYVVLRVAAAVFGNTIEGVRTGILVLGLLGSVGAYVALRATVGAAAGLLGAAFVAIAPPIPLYGTRVLSDLPALDLLLLSLAAAALAGRGSDAVSGGTRRGFAVAAGVLYVAACSVKLSVVVAAPAVVMLLLGPGRRRNLVGACAGAASLLAVLLLVHVDALSELRVSVVDYHRDLRGLGGLSERASIIRQVVEPAAAFTWLLAGAVVLAAAHTLTDRRIRVSPFAVLAASSVVLVVWHRPLFEHHLVAASVAFAICAAEPIGRELARSRGARRSVVGVIVGVLLVGAYIQQTRRVANELPLEDPRVLADAAFLAQRTRPGDVVVSDQPQLAYRARRAMPGNLIDTSAARFAAGLLTERDVVDAVDSECATAVVAGRSFTVLPELLRELERRFAVVERRPLVTVYLDRKEPCRAREGNTGGAVDSP